MSDLRLRSADDLRIDAQRLRRAQEEMDRWTMTGQIPAVSICIGRVGGLLAPFVSGRRSDEASSVAIDPSTTFLVASLTKPLTALAVVLLVERGQVLLDDPVVAWLPEFGRNEKSRIEIRHLLTHTSGLPDMLASNEQLRARHADQAEFVREIHEVSLLFEPGTQVRYQSMGFLILAAIVERVTGQTLRQFLRTEVFEPLGMNQTQLGARFESLTNHALVRLPESATATDWHWNSPYWLGFGAPWGGLLTTAHDYARFLRMMLRGGELDGTRVLSPAAARTMTTCRLHEVEGLGEDWIKRQPWGLGWRLNRPGPSSFFGDLLGPRYFGHWGSTGTVAWVDPDRDALAVILTTLPQDPAGAYLARASNLIAACFA